jgi:hypothetical protein
MLGEGFDLPNLKIGAIHSPHKSLAVTLQFIGRFARTGAENIGPAKFLAVPNDIRIETTQLYREEMVWQEIVPNLLEKNVAAAIRTGEVLRTFRPVGIADPDECGPWRRGRDRLPGDERRMGYDHLHHAGGDASALG